MECDEKERNREIERGKSLIKPLFPIEVLVKRTIKDMFGGVVETRDVRSAERMILRTLNRRVGWQVSQAK